MNLTRCKNGHFYDKEKFSECPHCQQSAGGDGVTEPIRSGNNGMVNSNLTYGNDVTAPIGATPVRPAPAPSPAYGNDDATQPIFPTPQPNSREQAETVSIRQKPPVRPIEPSYPPQATSTPDTFPASTPEAPTPLSVEVRNSQNVGTPRNTGSKGNVGVVGSPTSLQIEIERANGGPTPDDGDEVTQRFTAYGVGPIGHRPPEREQQHTKLAPGFNPVVGWFVCVDGASMGRSYSIRTGKNFIGRSPEMDIAITEDRSVSRERHAVVIFDPKSGEFLVGSGNSRELSYLDGEIVLSYEKLRAYQILTVGHTDLMFVPFCGEHFTWEEQIRKNGEK